MGWSEQDSGWSEAGLRPVGAGLRLVGGRIQAGLESDFRQDGGSGYE